MFGEPNMNGHDRGDRAIEAWCTVVSKVESVPVRISRRPDRETPGQGGCDAIVERGDARNALEHTSLDPYQRRRQDDDRYRKVVLPVAKAIEQAFRILGSRLRSRCMPFRPARIGLPFAEHSRCIASKRFVASRSLGTTI